MMPETKWRPTWKDEQTTCSRKPSVAAKGQKVRYIDQFRLKQADWKQPSSESQMKIKSDIEGWFCQVVSIPRRASKAPVLYYIISFQCVHKVFHLYKSLHFWREIFFYKDTLYELDKCFLQVLAIPECALLELQHCRRSNWPGFALKQCPLPLQLVPASSKPAVERTIDFLMALYIIKQFISVCWFVWLLHCTLHCIFYDLLHITLYLRQ